MNGFYPRILLVGLGSIGRRHLHNLVAMGYRDLAVCRRSISEAKVTHEEFGIPAFHSLVAAADWKPNIVLATNITSHHLSTALWALDMRCHVFIEKPLSHNLDGVTELISRADREQLCVAIGCNLHFHPALESIKTAIDAGYIGRLLSTRAEVGQYLPDWHPASDYRQEYSACSALGGGALLTLIHELSLVLWMAGDVVETTGVCSKISDLETDVDDLAEIVCRHTSGTVSSVHMDFLDRNYNRRSRWIGESGTIEWTWANPVKFFGRAGSERLLWEDATFDPNETYKAELKDFLSCVATGNKPRTTGTDGKRVLEVAMSVPKHG